MGDAVVSCSIMGDAVASCLDVAFCNVFEEL
jgi:hypothetical protein